MDLNGFCENQLNRMMISDESAETFPIFTPEKKAAGNERRRNSLNNQRLFSLLSNAA